MLTPIEIGKRIYDRRIELDLTLQEVADRVGVQNSTIYRYEKGIIKRLKMPVIEAIASVLQISPGYLVGKTDERNDYRLGNDEDSRALEKAKTELVAFANSNPGALSGKRLDVLFRASGYDHVVVCFNLGIDQYYLDSWMDNNDLPPKPIIDKILGVFRIKPEDLLSSSELEAYIGEAPEWEAKEKVLAKTGKHSGESVFSNEVNISFYDNPASNTLTLDESDLLRKYRALDDSGRGRVRNVLDYEYNALPGSETDSIPKEA